MPEPCEKIEKCAFLNKYSNNSLAAKGFIALYCKGTKQNICERKKRSAAGEVVPVDMLPNGNIFKG